MNTRDSLKDEGSLYVKKMRETQEIITPLPWTIKKFGGLVQAGKINKIKAQRRRRWALHKTEGGDAASTEAYITFLKKTKHTLHAITLAKNDGQYSNMDGNNRINAFMEYLNNPVLVFPSYQEKLIKFVRAIFPPKAQEELITFFSDLSYDTWAGFVYTKRHFKRITGGEELYKTCCLGDYSDQWDEFWEGTEDHVVPESDGFKYNFIGRDGLNFNDTKVSIIEYVEYTKEEINDTYYELNRHTTSMQALDRLSTILSNTRSFEIDNNVDLTNRIDTKLVTFYEERSKDEILSCYTYTPGDMNAYDFMIGYQDTFGSSLIPLSIKTTTGKTLFFKIWKTLYKSESSDTFTSCNVNNFITTLQRAVPLLEQAYKEIFNEKLKCIAKSKAIPPNSVFMVLSTAAGYLRDKTDESEIVISLKKAILYNFFKNAMSAVSRPVYEDCCKIRYVNGKGVQEGRAIALYATPNSISADITRDKMEEIIQILINENTKPVASSRARKERPMFEHIMMRTFYHTRMPGIFTDGKHQFWSEHVVPHSSEYDVPIDIDRLGNTVPLLKKINQSRSNKHINEYNIIEEKEGIEFMKHLSPIIPTNDHYDKIVSHKDGPKIISSSEYNSMCKENELVYTTTFLDNMFPQ